MLSEKKVFHRGSIIGGLLIVISCLSFCVSLTLYDIFFLEEKHLVLLHTIIKLVSIILFLTNLLGLVILKDGIMSRKAELYGHKDVGSVSKLYASKVEFNGTTRYRFYLEFVYYSEKGISYIQKEKVNVDLYEKLYKLQMIPIFVYGDRAVLNYKELVK